MNKGLTKSLDRSLVLVSLAPRGVLESKVQSGRVHGACVARMMMSTSEVFKLVHDLHLSRGKDDFAFPSSVLIVAACFGRTEAAPVRNCARPQSAGGKGPGRREERCGG